MTILSPIFSVAPRDRYGWIFPPVQAVPTGRYIHLECLSVKSVLWRLKGTSLKSSKNGPPWRYVVKATEYSSGEYSCVGTHANRTKFTAFATAYVAGKNKTVFEKFSL